MTLTVTRINDADVMSLEAAATILRANSFRIETEGDLAEALECFQDAWRLGPKLRVDRILGEKTTAALKQTERNGRNGLNTCSANFDFREFACQCGGKYADCRGVWVKGPLVDGLEVLRAAEYGDGLHILSGYRCDSHNEKIAGAASLSQHRWGGGCDVQQRVRPGRVTKLKVFSGVGYKVRNGLVCHVDVRGVGPANLRSPNTSGSTVTKPSVFPEN